MIDYIERFLEVYKCSVADQTGREQVVHDRSVSKSGVVTAKTRLVRVQLRLTGLIKAVYEQQPLEQLAVHTYQSDGPDVVGVSRTIVVLGDHVYVGRVPRCGSGPGGEAKVKQLTEHFRVA